MEKKDVKKKGSIRPFSERHSAPTRKEILTKTYAVPTTITQMHVIKQER